MSDISSWFLLSVFMASVALFILIVRLVRYYGEKHRMAFEASVGQGLREAFLFLDTKRLFSLQCALVVIVVAVIWFWSGNMVLSMMGAMFSGVIPQFILNRFRNGRLEKFRQQMPDLLMLLSGGLRAGMGLYQGIVEAAGGMESPIKQELELLLRENRLGVSLEKGLPSMAERIDLEELRLFVSALTIGAATGGNLADTFESLANAIRRKITMEGKIAALTAQGRLQAVVMGILPFFLGATMFVIDPESMSMLIETWYGICICMGVIFLQAIGILIIRRIVAIEI